MTEKKGENNSKTPENKKSIKRAKKLEEFKSRITDVLKDEYDDIYLNKWLKARQYDVEKAETMFRESLATREVMKVDTILETYSPPEVLQKHFAGGFSGFDKEGSPVRVELFGRLDIKGLMYSTRRSDLEKAKLFQCEQTVQLWKQQTEKLGRRIDGQTVLFDMEGVGMNFLWRPGLQMYLHLVRMMEDNYPEMMKRMFVINAPSIFPLLYKLCKPMISDDMRNKIHVLGSNYINTLKKYIDEDQIPAFLGGTKTDPDGNANCVTLIGQGGKVPDSYYLTDTDMTENMVECTIGRADKLTIPVMVEIPGSILRWEFKTDDYDIMFGVSKEDDKGSKVETIVSPQRVNSHIVTEDGSCIASQPGKYVICFDNTFSWTRSKKIKYLVEVHTNEVSDYASDLKTLIQTEDWDALVNQFETTHL